MFKVMFVIVASVVFGASVGVNITSMCEIRRKNANIINRNKKELYNMMNDFIEFYDKYELYFDKDMNREEFIEDLKHKGFIKEDFVMVPFGDKRYSVPADDTRLLRKFLYDDGELILDIGENDREILRIEEIDNYGEFSKKWDALRRTCKKHGMDYTDDEIKV